MRQSNSLKNFPTKTFDNKPFKSVLWPDFMGGRKTNSQS